MRWPTANEYLEAVLHPVRRFCKVELKRSSAALDDNGSPVVQSGKCTNVFELRGAGGHDRWAVGCFVQEPKAQARRYQIINEYLQQHPEVPLAQVEYHEQGICIRGRWLPITCGRWVEGQALHAYVRDYLEHPNELRLLADMWVQLAQELEQAGIAHGNLAANTVFVAPGPGGTLGLRLVDYDAVYVAALAELPPQENGHVDFQHPHRNLEQPYNGQMDRFSQLAILTALFALASHDSSLWDRFDNGNNLLFRHTDFHKPATSPLLRELWRSESSTVKALTGHLILACKGEISEVPPLGQVAQCLRPGAARSALTPAQIDQINSWMDVAVPSACKKDTCVDNSGDPSTVDDFVLEVEDVPASNPVVVAVGNDGIMKVPGMKRAASACKLPAAPPPLPDAAQVHPDTKTYEVDAWMPEEVAVIKLRGFVKDLGGEVISSVPGYIRVNLLDERDLAPQHAPGLLSWLGLAAPAPTVPRVLALMELNLVHKPTPTRKLIGITMRLTPGDDEGSHLWKKYCDKVFCELRGYLIGFA